MTELNERFDKKKMVMIAVAFGSLIVVSDVFDPKIAGAIGISLFGVMLFSTNMGTYIAQQINRLLPPLRAVRQ